MIVIVDYNPNWPVMFQNLRDGILPAIGDVAVAVEHVGSTAVPGLAAKPVIDVDVVVRNGDVQLGIERLQSIGYRHRGDMGIPMREAFHAPQGSIRHHLYLCPTSSPALKNHIAVRDHLRTNASDALAYGELKKRLAGTFADDSDGYTAGKTNYLIEVLRRCGFGEAALTEIAVMNSRPTQAG